MHCTQFCGSRILKIKLLNIKEDLNNQDEIDKLRLETNDLKKDLERERLLHNMLYKEWKELQEQVSAREGVEVENSKPGNGYYKYAFYILLILVLPIIYFLYPPKGFEKTHVAARGVSDSTLRKDSASILVTSTSKDTVAKIDAASPAERKENNEIPLRKTIVSTPVIKPAENKLMQVDTTKRPAKVIIRKPVIEGPITDDIRDSISSEGFSGYFYHNRNPYRRSSERYKIWIKGWNNGKDEAKKVVAKDPSLKNK